MDDGPAHGGPDGLGEHLEAGKSRVVLRLDEPRSGGRLEGPASIVALNVDGLTPGLGLRRRRQLYAEETFGPVSEGAVVDADRDAAVAPMSDIVHGSAVLAFLDGQVRYQKNLKDSLDIAPEDAYRNPREGLAEEGDDHV